MCTDGMLHIRFFFKFTDTVTMHFMRQNTCPKYVYRRKITAKSYLMPYFFVSCAGVVVNPSRKCYYKVLQHFNSPILTTVITSSIKS